MRTLQWYVFRTKVRFIVHFRLEIYTYGQHGVLLVQIDMDTIETSNLNRQFLFRKHHVGVSKARIAADSVRVFRPNANITVYQVRRSASLDKHEYVMAW